MSEDRETADSESDPDPDLVADGDDGSAVGGSDADGTADGDADPRPVEADADAGGASGADGDPAGRAEGGTDDGEQAAAADGDRDRDADGDPPLDAATGGADGGDGSDTPAVADGATAVAGGSGTVGADPTAADYDPGIGDTGPQEDVEMPLADHIEEMIRRLGIVFLVGGVVTLAVFPAADGLINYLWNTHIPGAATIADRRPRLYGPLELLMTELKVAGLAGLVAGLPVLVYQSYRFMRPGLYPNERRYYLAAVPTSLVLAFVGVAFAHFVVLPAIFAYFTSYTTGTALVAFGLRETFNLILLLMGYMAVVFQIPLLIMLGIMMGLVTRGWLEDKRLLFWGAFLGISFLVSPDPTGMAPIIVTVTMITLYEGTLALLRWTGN